MLLVLASNDRPSTWSLRAGDVWITLPVFTLDDIQRALIQHPQAFPVLLIEATSQQFMETWVSKVHQVNRALPHVFVLCVHASERESQSDSQVRLGLFNAGASMLTNSGEPVTSTLDKIRCQISGRYSCVFCGMRLEEDSLWIHTPLYHQNLPSDGGNITCPICQVVCEDPFAVHIRNAHGPCARGEVLSEYSLKAERVYAFSLVVCTRQGSRGELEMLLVHEFAGLGFWLPAGRVDPRESLQLAAKRECQEEAGIQVDLTGVLQIQYSPSSPGRGGAVRLRVVFHAAVAANTSQQPKSVPDYESCGATWATFAEIRALHRRRELRGAEPQLWADYLANGGVIHPMSVLGRE
ncbi:hypothetical protein BASA81_001766 [Batrachochytrium salamandrivorans]|nr:hypothetical protein BASA81_001766 [Batrachochytrium salamandrivorans]